MMTKQAVEKTKERLVQICDEAGVFYDDRDSVAFDNLIDKLSSFIDEEKGEAYETGARDMLDEIRLQLVNAHQNKMNDFTWYKLKERLSVSQEK